jgi:septal ring factor EnvC (AmiA/AmiB activator)
MAGGGSDKEQNYWPGFVDALSNVVLTLVFVLVVFVFALVITSGKVKQKSAQMAEQRVEQEHMSRKRASELETEVKTIASVRDKLAAELEAARQTRDRLQEEVKELEESNHKLMAYKSAIEEREKGTTPSIIQRRVDLTTNAQAKKNPGEAEDADVEGGNAIVITYPRSVLTLNDVAKAELNKVLETYRGKLAGSKAVLDAYQGAETYSEGRRIAYYRAMELRNLLLDRKVVARDAITISVKPNKDAHDGRIELRFVR